MTETRAQCSVVFVSLCVLVPVVLFEHSYIRDAEAMFSIVLGTTFTFVRSSKSFHWTNGRPLKVGIPNVTDLEYSPWIE